MTSSNSIHSNSNTSKEISEHSHGVLKVTTAGVADEFVIIGNQKFYRHELMTAFGGTLNPGLAPYPVNKFANPAPLGLSAFAMTTLVLSLCNAQAMGITTPNIVVGLACFYGGAAQMLAGIWELVVGNTFGGTALTSYGAFWLSYAAINIESFGIVAAYADDLDTLHNAIGFYLLAWGLFTLMLTMATLKSTAAFFLLFFCLSLTFFLLAAGEFTLKTGVTRAGGVVGVITGILGFYNALAGVANKQNSYFTVKAVSLTRG